MSPLKDLELSDRHRIAGFLSASPCSLSAYSLPAIYVWKALYRVRWSVIDGNLCLFLEDDTTRFLYLPPLGKRMSRDALDGAFEVMDAMNPTPGLSRIENVDSAVALRLAELGFCPRRSGGDYLYRRSKLAGLAGNAFKSKRAAFNYCAKHYPCRYRHYEPGHERQCRDLFAIWKENRISRTVDRVYTGMIGDTEKCLELVWEHWQELGMLARVVMVDARIAAFTFAYRLSPQVLCVAYEIAHPGYRGMSQYIFRMLCRECDTYSYINAMDDSGLTNLMRVKRSYRPLALIPSFTVTREASAG